MWKGTMQALVDAQTEGVALSPASAPFQRYGTATCTGVDRLLSIPLELTEVAA